MTDSFENPCSGNDGHRAIQINHQNAEAYHWSCDACGETGWQAK